MTANPFPYPGLAPFRKEDAAVFFGRDEAVEKSVERLLKDRFLAIVGASGIGKSSLIHAGIVPRLLQDHAQLQPIANCRFGAYPLENLADALASLHEPDDAQSQKGLLIIDQFEEIYTFSDEGDRQNTLRQIYSLLASNTVAVLIAIRADYMNRVLESPPLAQRFETSSVLLGPLSPMSLKRAIVEPAQQFGYKFENGLADRIIADVGTEIGSLPLLQIALYTLASSTSDGIIQEADYHRQGGIRGTLEQTIEHIWQSSTNDDQRRLKAILLRFVTISADGNVARRLISLDELTSDDRPVIERLVSNRLLVIHHDARSGRNIVEIAHEAIFRLWHRLSGWIDETREFLIQRERLSNSAQLWDRADRDSSYLLTGGALEQARLLMQHWRGYLRAIEEEYIAQSINATDRFSSWKAFASSFGLTRLQREAEEREKRRAEIQVELQALNDQLSQLEAQRAKLASRLTENRHNMESMLPKVFLSYASEDFPRVKPLYDRLKEHGLQPWLDRYNLLPGVDWDREIIREIKDSHIVLFCLSTRSINKRGYIQKELRTALGALDRIPQGAV